MGLKSTLKLLLLFCTLNLFLNQETQTHNLTETNPLNIDSSGVNNFIIKPEFKTKDYIRIVYNPTGEVKTNPTLIVALGTENCNNNRIAMSTQYSGQIYIFLRKGQFEKEGDSINNFIICIEKRESIEFGDYSIKLEISDKAVMSKGNLYLTKQQ